MRRELSLTPTELSLIFSAFAYPYAAMQMVGGWLSDKLGPRLVPAVLSVVWAAATIMTGLSWSIASLVAFRVLVGLGEGGAFPTATRAFTFWPPRFSRADPQDLTGSRPDQQYGAQFGAGGAVRESGCKSNEQRLTEGG